MLSRAIARSARMSAAPRTSRILSPTTSRIPIQATTIWSRGMAKNNRPRSQQPQNNNNNKAAPSSASPDPKAQQTPKSSSTEPAAEEGKEPTEPTPDFNSLPDLTQGIPSTFAAEVDAANKKAAKEEQAAAEGEVEGEERARGKGELPASAYVSSTDRRREKMANRMYLLALVGALGGVAYLGRDWEEDEAQAHPEVPNGWTPGLWWKRAYTRVTDVLGYYHEPAFEKLLPDPDPMFERPYTLCISLEDMLVHSEWSREHGWRVAKRPGMDYFIRYLSQYYELVLFTSVPFAMGEPLVRKLDPFRFIVWPLFREATKYKDGEVVKDLSYLNRDLSKVIILDTKASHVQNQPENAIVLKPWTGDPKDTELVSLIPFLEYIHTMQYGDVRKILKSFDGKHIPTEFSRREAIARAEFNKQFEKEKSKASRHSGMGALGSMLGMKPSSMSMMVPAEGEQSPSEAYAQGKMLQDIARERGQRNYEAMEKEIRANGEKWLKEEKEMQEKMQAEAMSSMKTGFMGWFGPSASEQQQQQQQPKN